MSAIVEAAAVFVGRQKPDVRTAGGGNGPVTSPGSRTFWRTSFAISCVCLGVAGVSAVAAAAICLLPFHGRSVFAPVLTSPMAPALSARARDVTQTWHEEWTQLVGRIGLGVRKAQADAWFPTGGLSTLLATRFPSAANVRLPGIEVAMPLPLPRPVGIARQDVARKPPVVSEPQLAALPPQPQSQPKSGAFSILDRLFADPDRAAKAVLAANPNTALYDIVKRVVYLPDGDKLEAHSGFGSWLDDPESVDRKDVGVTPPNVYAVSFREKPFHGVRALRMKPIGNGNMYGRDGILAHSYLLGDGGASNGCISVRDYDRFLKAYEDGKFNQIIVLRSADEPVPSQVASAQAQGT
jgi:Tlde1 domain